MQRLRKFICFTNQLHQRQKTCMQDTFARATHSAGRPSAARDDRVSCIQAKNNNNEDVAEYRHARNIEDTKMKIKNNETYEAFQFRNINQRSGDNFPVLFIDVKWSQQLWIQQ